MLAWWLLGAKPSAESLLEPWEGFGYRDTPKAAQRPPQALHEAFTVEDEPEPS